MLGIKLTHVNEKFPGICNTLLVYLNYCSPNSIVFYGDTERQIVGYPYVNSS